LFNNTY